MLNIVSARNQQLFYKQNPLCNGYYIVSESSFVLQSGYCNSIVGNDTIDWLVNELTKLENKMNFSFESTRKDIIMTEEDEKHYRSNNICRFCEKEIYSNKVRIQCHSTSKYRSRAHQKSIVNVTEIQSIFIPLMFYIFSSYDFHLFFKKLVDRKKYFSKK